VHSAYASLYEIYHLLLCTNFYVFSHETHETCRDSSIGIALDYGLDDRGSRVRFPAGAGNFSLHHRVQNGSGAHPASYPMGTRGSLSLGVKRPGREADHSSPSSAEVKEWVELYLHSSNTPPWRGAQLKHRDNFTFHPWNFSLIRKRFVYHSLKTTDQSTHRYHATCNTNFQCFISWNVLRISSSKMFELLQSYFCLNIPVILSV
jgi:hypothetical protein